MIVVAALGGGNGAIAAAAHLTLEGHDIRLYNRTPAKLEHIRAQGGVTIKGGLLLESFVALKVASSLEYAIRGADVIMLCVPALGHEYYASQLAPFVGPNQIIFLNPGSTGGAFHFATALKRYGSKALPPIAESNTLTYTCRLTPNGDIAISNVVSHALFGIYPANLAEKFGPLLLELYPELIRCPNVLETSLTNLNAVLHPPGMLLNAGWIEFTGGDFYYYVEGTTPAVAQIMEDVDRERLNLLDVLGLPKVNFLERYYNAGYTTTEAFLSGSVYNALKHSDANRLIKSPSCLKHRYLDEDVAFGLVPMKEFGDLAGVEMPVTDALIVLASRVNGVDYRQEGLTMQKMGFEKETASLETVLKRAKEGE